MKFLFNSKKDVELDLSFNEEGLKHGELFVSLDKDRKGFVSMNLKKRDDESLRRAFFTLASKLNELKVEALSMDLGDLSPKAVYEGFLQSTYFFDHYLSEKKTRYFKEVSFFLDESLMDEVKNDFMELEQLLDGVFLARDLTNLSAIDLYPSTLAQKAQEELTPLGVDVQIMGQDEIEKLGMEAFLAVSYGSDKEPKFIVMTYKNSDEQPIALVGKGLTYDSGGYSIKPADGMLTMHGDMAGAAAVIGAMKAIASNKLSSHVVAIVAATENLIDGSAFKTGDIIGSMSGKSIEVVNTDAEGRLTLADALYYATTVVKPRYVIDTATLTGAMAVALGNLSAGAVYNDKALVDKVSAAGEKVGEPVWALPNFEEYKEKNKSHFADIKNSGGRMGGGISAGMFLGEFVVDTPWVHIDIAGVSYEDSQRAYYPKGGTGYLVKTLYQLVKDE
ncbi:MAG TPA: leucyl aminopeptidase [Clostridia bacterium]|nr:leucyl aminopeptidase [Clostridia bacterium]